LPDRRPFDVEAYIASTRAKGCFICGLVSGDPAFAHHMVFEDDFAVAFLNKHPPLAGYVLVCPKAHREQVTGDFSREDYLRLQALVYDVCEALRRTLEVERVYVLSLGSQQANRHVHWHVAPLPPGVPLKEQQFKALDVERVGVLAMDDAEMADLARRIASALASVRAEPWRHGPVSPLGAHPRTSRSLKPITAPGVVSAATAASSRAWPSAISSSVRCSKVE
jgi:diadenosine tetraphosphate (Ap4A) HIT family hydrolase